MSKAPYTTKTLRGGNVVAANPQRLESADGKRSALGRNVKAESPRGRGYYDIVEVWTLKERRVSAQGKLRWEPVLRHCTREQAERWVRREPDSCSECGADTDKDGVCLSIGGCK